MKEVVKDITMITTNAKYDVRVTYAHLNMMIQ